MAQVRVTDLPEIADLLGGADGPRFVVLGYAGFVRFAAAAEGQRAPDVASVLDVDGEHRFVVVGYEALRQALLGLQITGEIDEAAYLGRHRDVAAAVASGALRCAAEHYIIQGYFERRAVRFPALAAERAEA